MVFLGRGVLLTQILGTQRKSSSTPGGRSRPCMWGWIMYLWLSCVEDRMPSIELPVCIPSVVILAFLLAVQRCHLITNSCVIPAGEAALHQKGVFWWELLVSHVRVAPQ